MPPGREPRRDLLNKWLGSMKSRWDKADTHDQVEGTTPRLDPGPLIDRLTMALSLVEQAANIAQAAPFVAPAAALLSQILEGYRHVKELDDRRDGLCTYISNLTGDICAAVLRMEEANHTDLLGRLKLDLEKYAALIRKASAFIAEFNTHGFVFCAVSRNQLDSKFTSLNEELNSFGARFRSNRLVDLAINQSTTDRTLNEVHDIVVERRLEAWLLSPPDMKTKLSEVLKLRKEGTCGWFLEHEKFLEWQDNAGLLWVQGSSGTGKTVLSSAVIEKLFADQQLFQHSHTPAVAFFYFELGKHSVETALRRIVLQLSAQSPHLYRTLDNQYKLSNGQTLPNYQSLVFIFQQLLRELGRAYIVLDALDECSRSDLDQLFKFLSTLLGLMETPLHVLITSQPRDVLQENIADVPVIMLEPDVVQLDIGSFLLSELKTKSTLVIWRDQADHIVERITQKSNGMFRLAACLLIELSHCQWEDELDQTLDNLPEDLFGIYDCLLQAIRPKDLVYVEAVLRWLLFSSRPLSMDELADAIAFDFSDSMQYTYKPGCRDGNARAIFNWLDGLIVVNGSEDFPTDQVTLAHASVHDYLQSSRFVTRLKFNQELSERLSHTFIARSCIDYLLYLGDHPQQPQSPTFLQQFALAKYVSEYWCYHIQSCHDRSSLYSKAMQLLDDRSVLYSAWWRWYSFNALPLTVCCRGGYIEGVQSLLKSDPDVMQDEHALKESSKAGHTDIVRLLLEHGFSDVNQNHGKMGAALAAACKKGHIEVVRLLIQSDLDLKSNKHVAANALKLAAEHGRAEIVHLLTQTGAGLDPHNMDGALLAASMGNHSEIVNILLDSGATVGDAGDQNPLVAACSLGRVDIVRLLLKSNLQNGIPHAALESAVKWGRKKVVQLLFEHISPESKLDSTLLVTTAEAAQTYKHLEIINNLLDRGADINHRTAGVGSALEASSRKGHLEAVHLLLQRGAGSIPHSSKDVALKLAAGEGHVEIVRLLLQDGAYTNLQNMCDALVDAAQNAHTEVVELLAPFKPTLVQTNGGNLKEELVGAITSNVKNPYGPEDLHGQAETTHIFLKYGANIRRLGASGIALVAAASVAQIDIINLLLDNGADVNLRTKYGTALAVSSRSGHTEVVRLLIERGANLGPLNSGGTTVLGALGVDGAYPSA